MPLIPFGQARPALAEGVFLAEGATLVGDVHIGEGVTVMFGAVARADRAAISVGAGSNIQDNVVIHADPGFPATIGAGVSIGHGAIVHGATIEDDCLIGMGATVLNGASVGAGSLVAAGAVVLEGTVIPPGSLVAGVPAKIRREITADERAAIADNAATYRSLGARYLEEASP